jgi:hypothetical protein
MKRVLCGAALLAANMMATPGWAANARNPYGNVNHANDAGNDTGDSQVPALNQAQLDQPQSSAAPYPYNYAPARPYTYSNVAPPAYYPPAPVYVTPRAYYGYGW